MSVRTCEVSQQLANEAIRLILEDEQSLFQLDDVSINRMIVCGKCLQSKVDSQKAKKAFRSSISVLAEKIDRFDEWGFNPEATKERRLEANRDYRKEKVVQIGEKQNTNRLDRRIQQLRLEQQRRTNHE